MHSTGLLLLSLALLLPAAVVSRPAPQVPADAAPEYCRIGWSKHKTSHSCWPTCVDGKYLDAVNPPHDPGWGMDLRTNRSCIIAGGPQDGGAGSLPSPGPVSKDVTVAVESLAKSNGLRCPPTHTANGFECHSADCDKLVIRCKHVEVQWKVELSGGFPCGSSADAKSEAVYGLSPNGTSWCVSLYLQNPDASGYSKDPLAFKIQGMEGHIANENNTNDFWATHCSDEMLVNKVLYSGGNPGSVKYWCAPRL